MESRFLLTARDPVWFLFPAYPSPPWESYKHGVTQLNGLLGRAARTWPCRWGLGRFFGGPFHLSRSPVSLWSGGCGFNSRATSCCSSSPPATLARYEKRWLEYRLRGNENLRGSSAGKRLSARELTSVRARRNFACRPCQPSSIAVAPGRSTITLCVVGAGDEGAPQGGLGEADRNGSATVSLLPAPLSCVRRAPGHREPGMDRERAGSPVSS